VRYTRHVTTELSYGKISSPHAPPPPPYPSTDNFIKQIKLKYFTVPKRHITYHLIKCVDYQRNILQSMSKRSNHLQCV